MLSNQNSPFFYSNSPLRFLNINSNLGPAQSTCSPFPRRRAAAGAMLRLRSCVLAHLLSSPATSPLPSLHRLLSAAAAPGVSPNPSFAVEEYLVSTCGLTRAQALKASPKLSHLKSPARPDAVLAFLAGLGLSAADVAAVVARDPQLLCAKVEKTLSPNLADLAGLGLSHPEIARLLSHAPEKFRCRSVISRLRYYLLILGSHENLLRALKRNPYLLSCNLETAVKPNVALLRECGLSASDIAKLCGAQPRLLNGNPEHVRQMVACAEGIGVPRDSGMFRQALRAVAYISEEKIAAKVDHLKKTFRWSDAEVSIAVSKSPLLLTLCKDLLQRKSEFLISEVELEPAYLAHRPTMLSYSLEGRLRPRSYVVKFLKANGLLDPGRDLYSVLAETEKVFMEKYICPHKEAAPCLAGDYADACQGLVPTNFRFT